MSGCVYSGESRSVREPWQRRLTGRDIANPLVGAGAEELERKCVSKWSRGAGESHCLSESWRRIAANWRLPGVGELRNAAAPKPLAGCGGNPNETSSDWAGKPGAVFGNGGDAVRLDRVRDTLLLR